jgi:hypothetical protein
MIRQMSTREENHEDARLQVARPWPVTVLGLLLLLQALGLLTIGFYMLALLSDLVQTRPVQPATIPALVFTFLAPLALWASVGFLRRWRSAWLNAMLLQGLCLMIALAVYFSENKPAYGYVVMAYSVYMVIYLNHYQVQEAFRTKPALEEEGE